MNVKEGMKGIKGIPVCVPIRIDATWAKNV
jgi:hypothetical protein